MTTLYASFEHAPYSLTETLMQQNASAIVGQFETENAAQEELLWKKLGNQGWGRINYFRMYETGWGEHGKGRPLSHRAYEGLLRFLQFVNFPEHSKKPSVFLTDNGGIELVWEDQYGNPIQVEFTSLGVEYYISSSQEEVSLPYTHIEHLAEKVSA